MKPKALLCAAFLAALSTLCLPNRAYSDDSAASIAAGGLVARREIRVVMAKEVLYISPTKIVVDYDFRNDSDQNVTTEVAFPVPAYTYDFDGPPIPSQSFSDFRLVVDGEHVEFQTEAKATLKGKDVTGILTSDGIDIPTFGHLRETNSPEVELHTPDMERLPKPEQERLVRLGLFGTDRPWGTWTVHLQYHWTQAFRAHSTVHIRHEYTPVEGSKLMPPETLKNVLQHKEPTGNADTVQYELQDMHHLESLCPDSSFLNGLIRGIEASGPGYGQFAHPSWVDFILTSANTWRQPIEDFTLIVERGKSDSGQPDTRFVSFCAPQNAPVTKLDADRFQVHLTNFVPTAELHIGYFDLPAPPPK